MRSGNGSSGHHQPVRGPGRAACFCSSKRRRASSRCSVLRAVGLLKSRFQPWSPGGPQRSGLCHVVRGPGAVLSTEQRDEARRRFEEQKLAVRPGPVTGGW